MIDFSVRGITVRAKPDPAGPATNDDFGGFQVLANFIGVVTRQIERYDTRAVLTGARRMQPGTDFEQPLAGIVCDGKNLLGNGRPLRAEAEARQQIEARTEAVKADHVLRAAFVAGCLVANVQLNTRIVAALIDAVPADHQWPEQRQMFLLHEKQPGAFGTEQPLMTIG